MQKGCCRKTHNAYVPHAPREEAEQFPEWPSLVRFWCRVIRRLRAAEFEGSDLKCLVRLYIDGGLSTVFSLAVGTFLFTAETTVN